jgi:serine/threonine protein kinase
MSFSYCFNPDCPQPSDSENADLEYCRHCQTPLVLKKRYRGLRQLGKSELALTLEVQDLETSSSKVCKLLVSHHHKARDLFTQEAYVLRKTAHRGIPKLEEDGYFLISDAGPLQGLPCIVMEHIVGQSLKQWLEQPDRMPLSPQQAQDWLQQLVAILKQLHAQDFFHRDIKPSNILLRPNGQLALIDFGASRQVTDTYLGKVGTGKDITCIGTPGYMPPEQMEGNALPQSDFFALGRTLVHLLTLQHPLALPKDQMTGELQWRQAAPQVPLPLSAIIDGMIKPVPGARPTTAQVLEQQILQLEAPPPMPAVSGQRRLAFLKQPLVWVSLMSVGSLFVVLRFVPFPAPLEAETTSIKTTKPVTCQNRDCIGRDPVDNLCDQDMQTLTSNTGNIRKSKDILSAYRIQLRYSKACGATWVKDEAPAGSVHYVEDRAGQRYGSATIPVDEFDEHYADMGPGRDVEIRGCVQPPDNPVTCTSFVKL